VSSVPLVLLLEKFMTRPAGQRGFTLIELLVVISIIALLIGILLPSLGAARMTAWRNACMTNSRSLGQAMLTYDSDRRRLPPDLRTSPQANPPYTGGVVLNVPTTIEARDRSWFGQLNGGSYIPDDPNAFDCPVVDDHRKVPEDISTLPPGERRVWYTDYVINRYAINQRPETAADPSRCTLVIEPNMARGSVMIFEHTIASRNWFTGDGVGRTDLEQRKAGSLSFGFVDGHVTRVPIDRDEPYPRMTQMAEVYPDLFIPAQMGNAVITNTGQRFYWRAITPSDMHYVMHGPPTQ
jgi:prepilin-type N-terminal cleavage/methylation domain-containing protein